MLSFLDNPLPSLSDRGLLHSLFEETARKRPEEAAVVCEGAVISYQALDHSANRFAEYLRCKGIRKGDRVCILLPKSIGLYAAIIGILKTGASYVPLDPTYPTERVHFIAKDCRAKAIITTCEFRETVKGLRARLVFIDEEEVAIKTHDAVAVTVKGLEPDDEAYVIYTSGTTGRPKGVAVSHGNAYHLVRAEQTVYGIRPEDRVLQGFSIAFDASVEEIWVTFYAGATLVVGTPDVMLAGPEMPAVLSGLKITVLSCVPSFLSLFEGDIPGIRILILGGEACIPHLLTPWFSPHRALYNTYGPTETTVVATTSRLLPGKPVTIGRPLPNYTVYIMSDKGILLEKGESGELVIGGPGVTKGYLNRDDLTKRQFIKNKYTEETGDQSPLLYRTGDRARINENGDIEYLGRIDTQVKIRGFRVELSEIEMVLMTLPCVKNAAVIARDIDGTLRLDAFVITKIDGSFSEHETLTELKKKLPPYMIPSHIEAIETFPTLPSGKIDRNGFPDPKPLVLTELKQFSSPLKNFIYRSWADIFRNPDIEEDTHFFTQLGGHSLLAAQFVSRLRKDGRWGDVSVRDLYDYPTIASLAAYLEKKSPVAGMEKSAFRNVPSWRHILCGFTQAIGLYFTISFFSLQWVSPFLAYGYMRAYEHPVLESLLAAFLALAFVYPALLILGVLLKWIVLGRLKEGDHPLWGWYYVRWLFVQSILASIPVHFLSGTPIIRLYLKLLGSQIGKDVYIDSDLISSLDALSIGSGTRINSEANISCHSIEDGLLKIRRVSIGNDVSIGIRSVVSLDTVIGDGAVVDDLTCVANGMRVGAGERLSGSPAVRHKNTALERKKAKATPFLDVFAHIGYGASFFVLPAVGLFPIFPGIMLLYHFELKTESYYYLLIAPVVAVIFVILSSIQIVVLKRLFLGKIKEGIYPIKSLFYVRKWIVDKLMEISLELLGTLYATLYLHPWYRALGVKLGTRAEVSTASFILPDLLTIGERSFIADGVCLGAAKVDGDNIILKPTVIGMRSFIGNSAFIPVGSTVGNDCLIGCQTMPPSDATPGNTAWVGTPAVFLPKRERRDVYFAEETTYNPGKKLYFKRLFIEFFRVILPSTAFVVSTTLLLSFFIRIEDEIELWQALLLFPLLYIGLGINAIFLTALMKRLIIGKQKPDEQPLWSTFVWKTELMTGFIENFTNMFIVSHLEGTVFLPWYLRLMGMKIGKRACIRTMDITEFDLVSLGDDVALNEDCTIQTHLFEDRVMKLGPIKIGSRVSVGSSTLVLYNTTIEDDVKIGDLSLVMKGETLPKNTNWAGSPVVPDRTPPV